MSIAAWTRPNGLRISRVRVPLGVIGIIYESRPNVTADAGALCLKSGNAAILRGGSESRRSSAAIHACLVRGPAAAGLPRGRHSAGADHRSGRGRRDARRHAANIIDVLVPRGGKSLVARVQAEARVPVIGHLEGNCHVYVDRDADLDYGAPDHPQCQDAPHRRLRRGRDAAGRPRLRRDATWRR